MEYKEMVRNAWAFKDVGFELPTVRDVAEAFPDRLVSIENDDYRGCPPASLDKLNLWYRGTDVLKTEVIHIVLEDGIARCWL